MDKYKSINDFYLDYDFNKFKLKAIEKIKLHNIINVKLSKLDLAYLIVILYLLKINTFELIQKKFTKHKNYTYFNIVKINDKYKYVKLITPAIYSEDDFSDSDYYEQYMNFIENSDPIIYDGINAYIFDKLNDEYSNKFNESYLVKYDYTFANICKVANNYENSVYWDYNELQSIAKNQNQSKLNVYNNICWIIVNDAIQGDFKSIGDIFKDFYNISTERKFNKILMIIKKLIKLNNFILFIGLKYGYLHNDLHLHNIIYDESNDKITLIDYGRNFFGYFYNNRIIDIDNYSKALSKYLLIGDAKLLKNTNINSYKDLYSNNFEYCKSLIINELCNYPTIILDLITLGLNIYYNFKLILLTNFGISNNVYKEIMNNYLEKIFILTENDIDALIDFETKLTLNEEIIKFYNENGNNKELTFGKLVEIFIKLKKQLRADKNSIIIDYKEIIDYLLDILLYVSIIFIQFNIFKGIKLDSNNLFYVYFQFVYFKGDGTTEINYINNAIKYISDNHIELREYNIYFEKLNSDLSINPNIIFGGNNTKSKSDVILSKNKIMSNYKRLFKP